MRTKPKPYKTRTTNGGCHRGLREEWYRAEDFLSCLGNGKTIYEIESEDEDEE